VEALERLEDVIGRIMAALKTLDAAGVA
jgi:hypothetical protein